MLNTLKQFLNYKDEEIFSVFDELQGYTVVSGTGYKLLVPTTNSVTPVLLCATVDTDRDGVKILDSKQYPTDRDVTILVNKYDKLGADSRAGCSMCYYMGKNFTSKPFILLTSDNHSGLLEFVDSNYFEAIRENIYQIISLTTEGNLRAEYGAELNDSMAELLMYDHEYELKLNTDDLFESVILQEFYSIPQISLSYGGYHKEGNGLICQEDYLKNFNKVISVVLSVHKGHSSYTKETKEVQQGEILYSCEICENDSMLAKYNKSLGCTICHACTSRIMSRHRKDKLKGFELIVAERSALYKDRVNSWIKNYENLRKNTPIMSVHACPVCNGRNVISSAKMGGEICLDCKIKYLEETRDDGCSFLFTGNLVPTATGYAICQGEFVYDLTMNTDGTYKVLGSDFWDSSNEYFKLCSKCNTIHPVNFIIQSEVLIEGRAHLITFCKACIKTV